MLKFTRSLIAATLALGCATAVAAAKDDLHDAFVKFLAVKSFRATTTDAATGKLMSTLEFVAPDRYRIKSAQGPAQLIVGDAMYMDMDGKMTRVPVPGITKMTAQFRNADFIKQTESGMTVTALPDAEVDGEPTHVYAYTLTQPVKADAKAWVSVKTGMPLQIESRGSYMGIKSNTRVRYSSIDDSSIRIDAPN